MSQRLDISSALAILTESLGHMGKWLVDASTAEKWEKRLQAKEPALAQDEFPVCEAAALLAGIASRQGTVPLGQAEASEFVSAYLADRDSSVKWDDYSIDSQYGAMLVHLSCQVALARAAQTVTDYVAFDGWGKAECPVCGAPPTFASLEGGEGIRKLVCGACATRWRYKRIGCSFCNEERPDKLKVLTSDDFPGWSATACLTCRCYLKTADLRQVVLIPKWESAALDTLSLDYAVIKWLDNHPKERETSGEVFTPAEV